MVKYVPDTGDVVWLEFEPQAGKEIQKTRPGLIISPKEYNNKTSLALCMPITSKVKGYSFEVIIKSSKIKGAILSDQVRSLDWKARKAKFICSLEKKTLEEALAKFMVLLPN